MSLDTSVGRNTFTNNEFSMLKAYILAELSEAAYDEPAQFAKLANFWNVDEWEYFSVDTAQAYVLMVDDVAMVVFRGTELMNLNDMSRNAVVVQVDVNNFYGKVHGGFQTEAAKLWPKIKKWLAARNHAHVYFTGHSLGAAIATITSIWYNQPEKTSVYLYGSPRVGNKAFSKAYDAKFSAYSFFYNDDIVPLLPFRTMGYKHVGKLTYFNGKSEIVEYKLWKQWISLVKVFFSPSLGTEWLKDCLQDHSIVNYKHATGVHMLKDKEIIQYYFQFLQ